MWLRDMGHMFKILSLFHVSASNLEVEVSCLKIPGRHLVLVSTPTFPRKVIVFCLQVCRLRSGVSLVLSFRCSQFIRKDSQSFCCSLLSVWVSPNSCSCVQVPERLGLALRICSGDLPWCGGQRAGPRKRTPSSAQMPCSLGELWALPPLRPCALSRSEVRPQACSFLLSLPQGIHGRKN